MGRLGQGALGGQALSFDFSGPAGDHGRLGAGLEGGPVLGQASLTLGQLAPGGVAPGGASLIDLAGSGQDRAGGVNVLGVEQASESSV
ncbi:MAG TPA: hypothetical protein VE990_00525 [Acidimicrobiales bacterium]|nr:hypothetical protein [Acidimicrobiales bacterium]